MIKNFFKELRQAKMLDQLLSMSAEFAAAAWLLVNLIFVFFEIFTGHADLVIPMGQFIISEIGLYLILLIVVGAGVMTAYYQYVRHEEKVK